MNSMRFLNQRPLSLIIFVWLFAAAKVAWGCPDIDGLLDTNCDGKLVIFTFGDSITAGFRDTALNAQGKTLGYPGRLQLSYFPHAIIRNAGLAGENSWKGVVRSASILSGVTDIDYFVLLEGTNDYYSSDRFGPTTKSNLQTIFRTARNTGALVLLSNLTDVKRSFQRQWILSVNQNVDSIKQLNFFSLGTTIIGPDGLHPGPTGYQTMAGKLASTLAQFSASHRPVDSDADGLYDYEEARYGTSVAQADSDADGISDGVEVWTYRSNPRSLDSDNDGLSDNFEVFTLQSNPASALPGAPVITELTALP